MPRLDYYSCKDCGATRDEVGLLSCTRLCPECSRRRMEENIDGIHNGSGPAHERRRYGMARALLGPRVALALKQAGVFDAGLLDEVDVGA